MKKIFILTLIIFVISSVFITLETVSTGVEIAKLEKTSIDLKKQSIEANEILTKTISLNELQVKSNDLKYIEPAKLVYLNRNEPVVGLLNK